MQCFADIVTQWEDAEKFAAEVGVSGVTARAWKARDFIPAPHWGAVVTAAQARGFTEVTADLLVRLAARKRKGAA